MRYVLDKNFFFVLLYTFNFIHLKTIFFFLLNNIESSYKAIVSLFKYSAWQ